MAMKYKNILQQINKEIKEKICGISYKSSNLDKYMSSNPLKRYFINRFLNDLVNIVRGCQVETVLDIGCGEGVVVRCLTLNYDFHINACDVDEKAVSFAKAINPDMTFFVADINSLPIEGKRYDLVICSEVLEHLQTPQIALKEIKRLSKGLCLISVPYEPYFSMMNFLSGKNLKAFGNDPDHIQRWTRRELEEVLARELEVISLTSSMPWLIALCRVKRD